MSAKAAAIAAGLNNPMDIARRAFEWVRDEVRHSFDYRMNPVTCAASEVLAAGTGYCYAKSHLLAALLRAGSIPAGMCYQRLSRDDNGPPYALHGFNAILLQELGWYRVDARGNRADVDAQFDPPHERLAFPIRFPGEATYDEIWPEPMPRASSRCCVHTARMMRCGTTCRTLIPHEGPLPVLVRVRHEGIIAWLHQGIPDSSISCFQHDAVRLSSRHAAYRHPA